MHKKMKLIEIGMYVVVQEDKATNNIGLCVNHITYAPIALMKEEILCKSYMFVLLCYFNQRRRTGSSGTLLCS